MDRLVTEIRMQTNRRLVTRFFVKACLPNYCHLVNCIVTATAKKRHRNVKEPFRHNSSITKDISDEGMIQVRIVKVCQLQF